ncbi:MAG TPA: carotenoid biosynthesis protein [Gemmatimonadaceae bacterium]|nr:carotenoid biosynthesis protein [Gemmatimonadaceae bacterium]
MPDHTALGRLAAWSMGTLLTAHVVVTVFSTLALVMIVLAPTAPAIMTWPYAVEVYAAANRYAGPLYVVLGALAVLAHATGALGGVRAFAMLAAAFALSLSAELVGTGTGLPFGEYAYTPMLGYQLGGRVPFPIPLSWFYMLYGCLAMCGRRLPARDDLRSRLLWAAVAGAMLTAWDISLDPAMSYATRHWYWIEEGPFYGMPWVNFAGWMLTGTMVAFAMLLVAPPSRFARRVSPSPIPIIVYAVNGLMPLAMVARAGLWWSFWPGLVAMGAIVAAAIVRRNGNEAAHRAAS